MPTPFPGMDPYLEQRGLWEQVHTRLIVAIADALVPLVRPKYRVDIELRVYQEVGFTKSKDDLAGLPDVVIAEKPLREAAAVYNADPRMLVVELPEVYEVRERYLEIRQTESNDVVTVIEVLSPTNKQSGEGRKEYLTKRKQILGSHTNLIEIDLIRAGERMPMTIRQGDLLDYHVLVSRACQRPRADVYTCGLRQPLPTIPVPLLENDPEPDVPLNQLLHDLYDRAGLDLAVDYRQPPNPPLSPEDEAWVKSLLQRSVA